MMPRDLETIVSAHKEFLGSKRVEPLKHQFDAKLCCSHKWQRVTNVDLVKKIEKILEEEDYSEMQACLSCGAVCLRDHGTDRPIMVVDQTLDLFRITPPVERKPQPVQKGARR